MDYKYIEQLLERYWECKTTLQEEAILKAFFSQEDVPAELQQYKALFTYELQKEETLGDDFDARILEKIQPTAKTVTLTSRLMPLFKAAAIIAIILTLGGALQAPWDNTWNTPEDYAAIQQVDTINVIPVQAENISTAVSDSIGVLQTDQPKD